MSVPRRLYFYSDAAGPNAAGDCGLGVAVVDPRDPFVPRYTIATCYKDEDSGRAEYAALFLAARAAAFLQVRSAHFFCDNLNVVTCVNNHAPYRPHLIPYYEAIMTALRDGGFEWQVSHIPRKHNSNADRLSRIGLRTRDPDLSLRDGTPLLPTANGNKARTPPASGPSGRSSGPKTVSTAHTGRARRGSR